MFYPEKHKAQLLQKLATLNNEAYVIVCFCAAWCRTCKGFETQVDALAKKYPQHAVIWVDVEEHENLLLDEDIEDFPTVLIQNKKGTLFYGPLLPFAQHIERVIEQANTKANYIAPMTDFAELIVTTA